MKTRFNLLTVAFLFISTICFGQSGKVNFGFEVYTNLADRFIHEEAIEAIYGDIEGPKLTANFGAVVSYRINPKLAFVS